MNKRHLTLLCAALIAVGGGAVIYSTYANTDNKPQAAYQYPPVKVALAPVTLDNAPRTFYGVGELEAGSQVFVAAETSGRITKIGFESGQQVKKGQLLVQLNDAVERADLARYQAQYRNASRLHERTRSLSTQHLVAEAQVDSTRAERDMAQGLIQQTQALIAQKAIHAPFDGTIGIRQVHEGQYLSPGEAIASLVDTQTLKLNFSLDEQASPELHQGQVVDITVDAYPDTPFPARITAIDPLIGKSRTVALQATLDNSNGQLKAGMYANVNVVRQANNQVLTIPETAVTYTAYGDTVFIAEGSGEAMTAKRISVKTGQRFDGKIEIEHGLNTGDQVVTSGQLRLNNGSAITPVSQDTLAKSTLDTAQGS
ncbi:efflux RND transporter periplasmic adaptor subunit [Providencia rustigianii]|uniref:efflux RND transporter periplasmic adaptor subunit n=1 Tax=Providencia rustigianii TaxID=158850 RepID=UPI002243AAD7|nr:efflux RND transporter periplasmic adaptor subunit [Providencia rustigianii]